MIVSTIGNGRGIPFGAGVSGSFRKDGNDAVGGQYW